jgi:zinc D-Ala-D-Ala dipeptidase
MTLVKYTEIKIKDSGEALVDLSDYDFVIDPKYYKQGLSNDPNLYLRKGVAEKLESIQANMNGYKFKIWDAYRSRDVQENIYKKFRKQLKTENPFWNDERLKLETGKFVSPPHEAGRIPPHVTGGAVDLTLVGKNGKELNMGTKFDHFGEESKWDYFEKNSGNKQARDNRKRLRDLLIDEGFRKDLDEWWHFDFGNQIWALDTKKDLAIYGETTSRRK